MGVERDINASLHFWGVAPSHCCHQPLELSSPLISSPLLSVLAGFALLPFAVNREQRVRSFLKL